jgi:glycosyltransferase 2 family protein
MSKKQIGVYGLVLAVLAVLVYLQFRTWKNFDWATFWDQGRHLSLLHILRAVGLIYFTYILRALRWKIFLRPVRPQASLAGTIPPTVIGFTGLALLGRAGELVRPYLIARREGLSFSSQMAVWAVERIFDVGAFTILLVLAIFLPTTLRSLPNPEIYQRLRWGGFLLVAVVVGLTLAALLVARYGEVLAGWVEAHFAHLAAHLGARIAQRVREFHRGLDTIHDPLSFLEISLLSVALWWGVALCYREVTHAYGAPLAHMTVAKVLLLMGSSMLGSLIQLPGVGGGSQLVTISALQHIFNTSHELSASCGILLWLVTFVSIVPLGLVLAHYERISLRELSQETQREEKEEAGA